MKLLVIFPSTIRGGAEKYAIKIAIGAAIRSWEVSAAFPKTEGTNSFISTLETNDISYFPLDIAPVSGHKFKLFREHLPHFYRILILLRKIKPEAVHLTLSWPELGLDVILACALLKIPTLVVFQSFPWTFSYSNLRLKAFNWARSRQQKWIAISENNKKFVCDSFQISPEQVLLIPNGTNINSNFSNCTEEERKQLRHQVRQELGIPEASQILLTVARLEKSKGYADLVEIVPHVIKEFPNIKFIWVGEGSLKNYLEKRLKQYGLTENVLLLGFRSDIPPLLKSADLFIFPTYFEGLPFAIIEAIAHDLPIIASDASSIPEIIENRVQGLLFKTGDRQKLLEAINWAIRHPEAMEEMAEVAREKLPQFSATKMVEQTLSALEENSRRF